MRTRAIAWISHLNRFGMILPQAFNYLITSSLSSKLLKKLLGFAPARSIPKLSRLSLRHMAKRIEKEHGSGNHNRTVYLFADEFTDYNDTEIGIKAIKLLNRLGFRVIVPDHTYSGRTFLSKGLVKKAKKLANKNVSLLKDMVSDDAPLLGIEPSAILTFRDEYPELVDKDLVEASKKLASNCLFIEEFIAREWESGRIDKEVFSKDNKHIKLHGHCHQKALASTHPTKKMLSIPENYTVEEIPSGCCGMAGSFGYEKEHYELSMNVGEMVLFPAVRSAPSEVIIAAPGTSCRHQIADGTGRHAMHPVEVLFEALA
jgi:Fe-S oxidoreductase